MRARTALSAAALAVTAAFTLSACGGGSGTDGNKIPTTPPAKPSAPTSTPSASAASATGPVTVDPGLKLPAGLRLVFDFTAPTDHTQAVVLTTTANFMQSMVHAVAGQNPKDGTLYGYATGGALTYAQTYVKNHVALKRTLTGTDHFYRPVVKIVSPGVAQVAFCENDTKLYSKDLATGKVNYSAGGEDSYTSYAITLSKAPTKTERWQAQSVTYQERAAQCQQ
jgi:hypothetical protein